MLQLLLALSLLLFLAVVCDLSSLEKVDTVHGEKEEKKRNPLVFLFDLPNSVPPFIDPHPPLFYVSTIATFCSVREA